MSTLRFHQTKQDTYTFGRKNVKQFQMHLGKKNENQLISGNVLGVCEAPLIKRLISCYQCPPSWNGPMTHLAHRMLYQTDTTHQMVHRTGITDQELP